MSSGTQFGQTLFLSGFQSDSTIKTLERLHFLKNAASPAEYDEAWLQRLIMLHPSLLPLAHIEPAFDNVVPVCIELRTKSGFLDNLLITPKGDLALVECKLWRNPQARREVIAQIIDYAKEISGWTYENLQDAIRRTKSLDDPKEKETRSLYELVSADEDDEASFHDRVSRNLKLGRFLLLIVGDGIREEMEGLAEFLQQHAGFHFTIAFVEIALFKLNEGYIAQPRVLAKTTNIVRGIVTLEDNRIVIGPSNTGLKPGSGGRPTTITQEHYFEGLETKFPGIEQDMNAFFDTLATYDVSAEYGSTRMMLRWRPENGRDWNLGTISEFGLLVTEHFGKQASSAGLLEFHKQYLAKLAGLVPGAYVKETAKQIGWYVARNNGYITVDVLVANEERRNGWVQAIADFQSAVKSSLDE